MRTRSTSKKIKNDNKLRNNKINDIIIEIKTQKTSNDNDEKKELRGKENFLNRKRKIENTNLDLNFELNNSLDKLSNKKNRNQRNSPKKENLGMIAYDVHDIKNKSEHPRMMSEVFNESFVDSLMYWRHENPPGSGLKNLGNTCFLNSVLQCILYTVPLKNYLDYSEHSQMCKIKGVCFICEYGRLSKLVELKKSAIIPQNIIQNIRNIAHHIKIGRQEDAHEFLLYFLAAMENSATNYLHSISKKFSKLKNNTFPGFFEEINLIQKIFGGTLISRVTCGKCKNSTTKLDKFIDISLEIVGCKNISECFNHFCKAEYLTGNNKYFCDGCRERNDSVKKLTFEKFPRILVVHLKRFDNKQRKIKNFIEYDKEIDLNNFSLSSVNKNKEKTSYRLNSILIHEGSSIYSGHYYCYVRVSDNNWYCFNDDSVRKVEESKVLKQTPYLLFYEKILNRNRIGNLNEYKSVEKTSINKEKVSKNNTILKSKNLNSKILTEKEIRRRRNKASISIKPNLSKIINEEIRKIKNEIRLDLNCSNSIQDGNKINVFAKPHNFRNNLI